MLRCQKSSVVIVGGLVLLVLAAVSGAAESGVVYNGIDVWRTSSDGSTYTDFAVDPIPAGFFCPGSPPFSAKIRFRGAPVATEPAGALGGADTIVHRLDDGVFDSQGVARTRIQVQALSLVSVEPIDVGCGRFHVTASLAGRQPITEMEIFESAASGGTFEAHLELRVKLTFRPVKEKKLQEPLELRRIVRLDRRTLLPWSYEPGSHSVRYEGFVKVDTDGDGSAETFLPGTSNFVTDHPLSSPGEKPIFTKNTQCCAGGCWWNVCHCALPSTNPTPTTPCSDCTYLHCVKVFTTCVNECSSRTSPPEGGIE